ncbi:hypothetical protein MBLNU459_g0327t1 [Dothideomycetes sp. NU459]
MENHYQALGLSVRQFDASLTAQEIKQAYRVALLRHHPDKVLDGNLAESPQTVDAITVAYKVLSEPASKAEYDRTFRLSQLSHVRDNGEDKIFHTGLDITDLDDLHLFVTSNALAKLTLTHVWCEAIGAFPPQ